MDDCDMKPEDQAPHEKNSGKKTYRPYKVKEYDRYLEALKMGHGRTKAAEYAGLTRPPICDRMRVDPDFRAAVEAAEAEGDSQTCERLEAALVDVAASGNLRGIIYYLSQRSGGRWTAERQPVQVQQVVQAPAMSLDDIRAEMDRLPSEPAPPARPEFVPIPRPDGLLSCSPDQMERRKALWERGCWDYGSWGEPPPEWGRCGSMSDSPNKAPGSLASQSQPADSPKADSPPLLPPAQPQAATNGNPPALPPNYCPARPFVPAPKPQPAEPTLLVPRIEREQRRRFPL
jgi:hypothetical protein